MLRPCRPTISRRAPAPCGGPLRGMTDQRRSHSKPMVEARSQRITRSRKKNAVPLSSLRTSEVVRAVVDHPHRLAELIGMLEDRDRAVRGRAAATLARLSETHAGRLVRIIGRLREGLSDDSAYVRWSLTYALGLIAASFTNQVSPVFSDLVTRLDDDNRIVRILAFRAIERMAARRPQLIKDLFAAHKRDIPKSLARSLKSAEKHGSRATKRP